MLAKQYWRMIKQPNSLLVKTFKAKYYPKTHHSWIGKNLIGKHNTIISQGRWLVGRGCNIPLSHPVRYESNSQKLSELVFVNKTVSELIDTTSNTWKLEVVRKLYQYPLGEVILKIPLPKTGEGQDKILWSCSNSGDYQVKKAYEHLHQEFMETNQHQNRNSDIPKEIWNLVWKVKLPIKINTFIWKLLHESIPINLKLIERGIPTS